MSQDLYFVPPRATPNFSHFRLLSVEQIEAKYPDASEKVLEESMWIRGFSHLKRLCRQSNVCFANFASEYLSRVESEEQLLEDWRDALREALALTRGSVPDCLEQAGVKKLNRFHNGLQDDIDEAQTHLSNGYDIASRVPNDS